MEQQSGNIGKDFQEHEQFWLGLEGHGNYHLSSCYTAAMVLRILHI
jgi:hypothetical protein